MLQVCVTVLLQQACTTSVIKLVHQCVPVGGAVCIHVLTASAVL